MVIRFPSYEAAKSWYHSPDYAEAKAVSADASYDGYAEAPGEPGGGGAGTDSGATDETDGCGCASDPGRDSAPAAWLSALALLGLQRQRRRR